MAYDKHIGLKLRVSIRGWCRTLVVSLLRSNMKAASHTLQKKYAQKVVLHVISCDRFVVALERYLLKKALKRNYKQKS
jgi:hypothetical protein